MLITHYQHRSRSTSPVGGVGRHDEGRLGGNATGGVAHRQGGIVPPGGGDARGHVADRVDSGPQDRTRDRFAQSCTVGQAVRGAGEPGRRHRDDQRRSHESENGDGERPCPGGRLHRAH